MSTSELSAVSHYVNRKLFEWLYNSVSILKNHRIVHWNTGELYDIYSSAKLFLKSRLFVMFRGRQE